MDCACCRIHTWSSFLMEYPRPEEIDPREKLAILAEQEHLQEEINHPEETVHGRAFIKNFDD